MVMRGESFLQYNIIKTIRKLLMIKTMFLFVVKRHIACKATSNKY